MAKESFLINPPRSLFKRRVHKRTRRSSIVRHNPFGEAVMIVGSNPLSNSLQKKRRSNMLFNPFKKRRRVKRHRKHYGMNPRRKKHYRRNPRKHYRRNPFGLDGVTAMIPMVGAGAAGAIAVSMVPGLLGLTKGTWQYWGTQAAVVVGGGWAANKVMGSQVKDGWIVGASAIVLAGVISSLLTTLGVTAAPLSAFPPMGAFPQMNGFGEYGDPEGPTYGYT